MGKSSDTPEAPDPVKTAEAQTAMNKETALWNAMLNNVNQVTPYGSLTYSQSGGETTYDYDAYNAALEAYKAQSAAGGQKSGGATLGDSTWGSGQGTGNAYSGGTALSAPKLSDYATTSDTPPQFTSTIKLSPEQQELYDISTRSDIALAGLGENQLSRIQDSVSTPFSFSDIGNEITAADTATAQANAEAALMERLNPQFGYDEESLRTRLINQGIGQGSEAYNREMQAFNQAKNDARTSAVLSAADYAGVLQNQALQRRQQGITEYTTERNAPLNEYIGMTSGTQVTNPTFTNTGYTGANSVDYANLVNNQYQSQLAQSNANTASSNSLTGSLFGLGGSFLGSSAGSSWLSSLLK